MSLEQTSSHNTKSTTEIYRSVLAANDWILKDSSSNSRSYALVSEMEKDVVDRRNGKHDYFMERIYQTPSPEVSALIAAATLGAKLGGLAFEIKDKSLGIKMNTGAIVLGEVFFDKRNGKLSFAAIEGVFKSKEAILGSKQVASILWFLLGAGLGIASALLLVGSIAKWLENEKKTEKKPLK